MSLTLRLALTYLLITLGGLLLLGSGAVLLAGRYDAARREQELGGQADIFAAFVAEVAPNEGTLAALAPGLAARAALPSGVVVRIFAANGQLLSPQAGLGPFPSRPAVALVRASLPLPVSQVPTRRYAARSAGPGIVEISQSTDPELVLRRNLLATVAQAALGSALVMALVSLLLARSIARPITRLQTLAGALASGDLARRARPLVGRRRDEIGALAASLDEMAAEIQRRIAEAEGERARLQAMEQARVRFVRSVSHELRTPLTAITGLLEQLRDDARPDQQASLALLEDEAARLGRLAHELLRPSQSGALPSAAAQPVDLAGLAEELCALQQGRARRAGIALRCTTDPAAPSVLGDRDRLRQALLNLVDNGLRATPPGGSVHVSVVATEGGQQVRVVVADTGPGVPPDLEDQIWERGVSGSGGAGLGLALVQEIVAAHGGSAQHEASAGEGTRFSITLPAAPAALPVA
jgi:signal transduction histidine kinase